MSRDYKVRTEFLNLIEFEVLILEIPEVDIEDKLAYLAREKGKISKSLYEDFVIATCVANVNQLLYLINQHVADKKKFDLLAIRDELMTAIITINPKLNPDILVINRNYVIKIRTTDDNKDERALTGNSNWDISYYDEIDALYSNYTKPGKEGKEAPPAPPTKEDAEIVATEGDDGVEEPSEQKPIEDLEYEKVQKWWKRIGQYVVIKKFSPKDAESILKARFFHNRTSFSTFVVSSCVENFESLFELLDNMGLPNRVAAPILMHELYELCRSCNEFLTFENAQVLSPDGGVVDDDQEDVASGMQRSSRPDGSMGSYVKKKPKKRFKDVSKDDLLSLGDNMKVFLVGQNEAVDTMSEAIQRASVGLKDPSRPIGSFLFAGQTGVGKTLATKVLADELIKSRDNIVTIDCSEFSADHEYSKLIGAPSGYVGHENGGMLTNAIAKTPFSVVVFDEVEKASQKVHELLLQILDEGRLTDGKGVTVSFKDAVVVMTSNVGVDEVEAIRKTIGFGDASTLTDDKKGKAIDTALKNKFKPEFLNRIDSIVNFKTLIKEDYMKIIDIELHRLNENLKNNETEYKDMYLEFEETVREFVYNEGIDDEYGARPLKRCIEKKISTPLAHKLLSEKTEDRATVRVSIKNDEVGFVVEKRLDEPPFYITKQYQQAAGGGEIV